MSDQDDLVWFVREHVRSVWTLEVLLLLRRDAERCWSPAEIVKELRASHMLVLDVLGRLSSSGLAMHNDDGSWRYAPATPKLDTCCADLEAAFRQRPVAVVNLIASSTQVIQSLADAFKFRGDGK